MLVFWGKFIVFSEVQFGHLHYWALESDKILVLTWKNKGNFDKKKIIPSPGNDGIYWWFDNISTAFNAISIGNKERTLIADVSKLGAVLGVSSTNESFTLEEK